MTSGYRSTQNENVQHRTRVQKQWQPSCAVNMHTSSCLVRARNRRWQTNIFNLTCATRKKGNYDHVTSMFLAWLMPHLYFTKTSRACSCIASGSEQTVAFIAVGSSGLRSLRVPLERCVGWGGSNFICKFQYRKPGWLWTDLHYFHEYLHNDELNSRFHMGISKYMYHVRATHIHSTLSDCYILKYLLLNLAQNHPGLRGDLGYPNIYMVFQSNTASRIQNEIVCDLFGTIYKFLTQTVPFIIKPVDLRFNCSFSTKSGKVWPHRNWLILVYFRNIHEKHIRQHIIQANYS